MSFGTGLVIGKFYPPHAGHHHLIATAAAQCDTLTVVAAPSRRESIPLDLRLTWLRAEHPTVHFIGIYDDHPVDYGSDDAWDAHVAVFREAAGTDRFDAVFSSEEYGAELARRFRAVHVPVDPPRATVPVSGTAIRADPVAHWEHLAPPVRAWFARRVIAVGAESTGTTTIASALAAHYRSRGGVWANTRWVPEFGRELTERKLRAGVALADLTWDRDDFVEVVTEQNRAEDEAAALGSPVLFGDTDAAATAIWERRYLGSTSTAVLHAARKPDLYLLTDHEDVPFEDDGTRDGEHLRAWMTGLFRTHLAGTGVPVVALRGPHETRMAIAVAACDALLDKGWSLAEPEKPRS
ncbi:AAA family ATPase [Catenuloplanes japonicus]|uniref:AAA family ATPase n=1 Tax=Catenuloplanes japonicus TaxID=33876 RepID=UPI00052756DF|nr:AAA family ATPase [Catenuloplanes japonicus]